jgi:hypothetical protein
MLVRAGRVGKVGAVGGNALGRPSLDLSFTNNTLDPRITFTRAAGGATYFDVTGTLQNAGTNVPRFDYDPSTAITNYIRNSILAGAALGTPGTLPTNWVGITNAGLTTSIVGIGTESGIAYIDIKFTGTSNAVGINFPLEAVNIIPAVQGQTFTQSCYFRLVGGTLDNVTSVQHWPFEYSITPTFLGNGVGGTIVPTNVALTQQRSVYTYTTTNAIVAWIRPVIGINIVNGAAIDFTLRVGAPQLELSSTAHQFIPTSGVAASGGALPRGLLIEEARTNLVLQSGNLANAAWQLFNSGSAAPVVTANNTTAPDGTVTAARIVFPTVSVPTNNSIVAQSVAVTAAVYSGSIYLKGSVGGEQLYLYVVNAATYYRVRVTLTTSWQRFSVVTSALTAAGWYLALGCDLIDVGQTAITAQTIFAWGGQVELGAFATSYIPTVGATVTRAADVATMPTGPWFNAASYSITAQCDAASAGGIVYSLTDASGSNNRLQIQLGSLKPTTTLSSGGVNSLANPETVTVTANTVFNTGSSLIAGTYMSSLNGAALFVSTTGIVMPAGVTQLALGQYVGGNILQLNGHIRRVRYWPRALTSIQLQSATS